MFWQSAESKTLLNPRLSEAKKNQIHQAISQYNFKSVIWVQSSGTESSSLGIKMVCLPKPAFLVAAASVNQFFEVSSQDVWVNPLPSFHVGGLSIKARCFLSQAKEVVFSQWDAKKFSFFLKDKQATLTSLVPTQVFDLLSAGASPPSHLRAILVGGGALDQKLYSQAWQKGWPLYPSYGMTESCALMAAALFKKGQQNPFPDFKILDHIQLTEFQNKYAIKSEALFKGYLFVSDQGKASWQPCPEAFIVDDHLEVENGFVKVLARESEIVKILGETVNIASLEKRLSQLLEHPVAIVAKHEPRRGYNLDLWVEALKEQVHLLLDQINTKLMPYERLSRVHFKENFPRTELGKIKKSQLLQKSKIEKQKHSK